MHLPVLFDCLLANLADLLFRSHFMVVFPIIIFNIKIHTGAFKETTTSRKPIHQPP